MKNTNTDVLRVLLAVKENVFRDLHCGMVYKIKAIREDVSGLKFYTCSSINNEQEIIDCVAVKFDMRDVMLTPTTTKITSLSQNFSVNDIVVVLHCDEDFRANLKNAVQNKQLKQPTESNKHTLSYGVIVGLIWKGNS